MKRAVEMPEPCAGKLACTVLWGGRVSNGSSLPDSLLGNDSNRNLLVHFINATLASELVSPITSVEILNPYNEKEFLDDKLTIRE